MAWSAKARAAAALARKSLAFGTGSKKYMQGVRVENRLNLRMAKQVVNKQYSSATRGGRATNRLLATYYGHGGLKGTALRQKIRYDRGKMSKSDLISGLHGYSFVRDSTRIVSSILRRGAR
jgi:hypothetical protein